MAIMQRVKDKPGQFFIPSLGKYINIVEWRVGDRYDTAVTASGAITAGTQKTFFRDLTNKDLNDANFPQPKRILGTGEEMVLERVGVYFPLAVGNTQVVPPDIKKAADGSYVELKVNRDQVAAGPAVHFPSGYGLAGQTTDNAQGIVTNGIASSAAAQKLAREQELTPNSEVDGVLTYFDHLWDTTNMATLAGKVWTRVVLHGLIKEAATRGT